MAAIHSTTLETRIIQVGIDKACIFCILNEDERFIDNEDERFIYLDLRNCHIKYDASYNFRLAIGDFIRFAILADWWRKALKLADSIIFLVVVSNFKSQILKKSKI